MTMTMRMVRMRMGGRGGDVKEGLGLRASGLGFRV